MTLFGIVPSQQAKAAAEADARKVSGVKRVENELQVVASAKQAAGKVRDEEVERAVKQAFDTPDLKDISIEVKNGVVRLTGTVPSGARRLEAAVAARAVPGRARGRGRSAPGGSQTLIVLAHHVRMMRWAVQAGSTGDRQLQKGTLSPTTQRTAPHNHTVRSHVRSYGE